MKESNRYKRKERLYEKYSRNFFNVRSFLKLDVDKQYEEQCYICPLTFRMHNIESLDDKYLDSLTFEHAPPKSLGGNVVALTSKNINTSSGHSIDENLRIFVQQHEFKRGNGQLPVKYYFGDGYSMKGNIKNNGGLTFEFLSKTEHHAAKILKTKLQNATDLQLSWSINNPNNPQLGILKTALLIAFRELGYSFYFGGSRYINPNTIAIIDQLANPDKEIIGPIRILQDNFPDDLLGASIIYEPRELRSVLVVFDLVGTTRNRIGVLLPGPDEYGWNDLQNEMGKIDRKDKINFKFYAFRRALDLRNEDDSLEFLRIWEEYNGITR